jgi:hypothetical protein
MAFFRALRGPQGMRWMHARAAPMTGGGGSSRGH